MLVKYENIDNYINAQADFTIEKLVEIRAIIKTLIPNAVEVISYGMPAFKYNNEVLIYFAACKKHLGFYPTNSPIAYFKNELHKYKYSKGCIQFPYDTPLPKTLIKKIIQNRLKSRKLNFIHSETPIVIKIK